MTGFVFDRAALENAGADRADAFISVVHPGRRNRLSCGRRGTGGSWLSRILGDEGHDVLVV